MNVCKNDNLIQKILHAPQLAPCLKDFSAEQASNKNATKKYSNQFKRGFVQGEINTGRISEISWHALQLASCSGEFLRRQPCVELRNKEIHSDRAQNLSCFLYKNN